MREVAGALERPADTEIDVVDDSSGMVVTVVIPRPKMPWLMVAAIVCSVASLLAVLLAGVALFFFHYALFGYRDLVGSDFQEVAPAWQVFTFVGWLTIIAAGLVTLNAAIRPLTRRERIVFDRNLGAVIQRRESLGSRSDERFAIRDIGEFRNRRDPLGLRESELVMLLNRPLLPGGVDEEIVAPSTTEAEKQWLVSVLNILLEQTRPDKS